MAAARFCSECGERLKLKRRGLLPLRSFCRHCSPQLKAARLMWIAAPVVGAAIGFAAGRYSVPREPFYFIGTPVELSSNQVPPAEDPPGPSRDGARPSPQQRRPIDGICGALTKSGRLCQRKVKGGGYCYQHRDKIGDKSSQPSGK